MPREPHELVGQLESWLFDRHDEEPITGDDMLELVFNLTLRMRGIWTIQQLANLYSALLQEIAALEANGELAFTNDEGETIPFITRELLDGPEGDMYRQLKESMEGQSIVPDSLPDEWESEL